MLSFAVGASSSMHAAARSAAARAPAVRRQQSSMNKRAIPAGISAPAARTATQPASALQLAAAHATRVHGGWRQQYGGNSGRYGGYSAHSRRTFSAAPEEPVVVQQDSGLLGGAAVTLVSALACGLAFFLPSDKKDESKEGVLKKRRDVSAAQHLHLPIEKAVLTFAPEVPPPIKRKHPARLQVDMAAIIREMPLDETNKYEFWTFNNEVPGPMIRGRVGDVLDITLYNADASGMQHNLDFHAVTGPGGGAPVLNTDYDKTTSACFKLLLPGLYIYHCAVSPVGWHIGNGMYGMILVEPEEGLPPVDHEYYIVQAEVYTEDPEEGTNVLSPSFERGLNEQPNYVVFNGRVGSMVDTPLKAKTGERCRFYFGNAGPNLVSSLHIIGTIFDKVWREGDFVSPPARNLQTTLVPSGGVTMLELVSPVPGVFTIVDHSIWRIEKGAVGFLEVEGEERPDIFHSDAPPNPCADCKLHP